jgi:hypothetical protein
MQLPDDEFDACRLAFIATIKREDEFREKWERHSLRQHRNGKRDGFADQAVQRRWVDFLAAWIVQQARRNADPVTLNVTAASIAQAEVLNDVCGERTGQDAQWGGAAHDDEHMLIDFVELIAKHNALAAEGLAGTMIGQPGATADARRRWVQVAALAVAAIESLDRKTGKHRVDATLARTSERKAA